MNAEIISIGDELTSGQRLDTNSQWLSRQLGDLGIRVLYHSTVGDELQANVDVIRVAVERAKVIVTTGGLGPTADDLTRHALAAASSVELVTDNTALSHIRQLFAHRGRPMPERNVVQAMFPAGSRVIPNPHGSAPGIYLTFARSGGELAHLFALPGVPAEMREMWAETVAPVLTELLGGGRRIIRHRRVKCFGVGESDLEQMLPDLVRRGRTPSVGITVSRATITLRVTAEGESEAACDALIVPTLETIYDCLGELVFGSDDDELQHAVVRLLSQRGQSLATLECGSGGLLADWLSDADEAGTAFVGGSVVRGATAVAGLLDPLSLAGDNVSEWLEAAAERTRQEFSADYALAVGPFPRREAEPSQRICFALATADRVVHDQARFAGHPDILKARSTKQALNLLRLYLARLPGGT